MTKGELYDVFDAAQKDFLAIASRNWNGRGRSGIDDQAYPWWETPVRTVHSAEQYIRIIQDPVVREAAINCLIAAYTYMLACSTSVPNAMLWKLGQNLKAEYGLP